ncbi:hypothetical protein BK133_22025 [Paenibacillus sp. FSL H8-0548]|uniref:hypothetical protein n=1 Tax=Paenibacillus sp. FSL H8-0548 TaxID=1920422 RepID=UPI00096D4A9B|nr:hypothetical protein [Paenibacillus sp. FSL H8-0548]OMF24956.1 hypothetical protein BK133_22025 [Paenibacillus sp. FSL H8-0548]
MSVNRDELKRMIDQIPDQDAVEVHDFFGYLNLKREREAAQGLDVEQLSTDEGLIRQVGQSREDRQLGRVYDQEAGLDYLRMKVEEFERGQNL